MKKIYMTLLAGLFHSLALHSQTLTQAGNEPAPGDIYSVNYFDSTAVIPKSPGTNQTWDFSSITQSTNAASSTSYVAASSVSSSSLFPGATMAQNNGNGNYSFYKSTSTPTAQLEELGSVSSGTPPIITTYTNTFISVVWPVSYGTSFSDNFSGPLSGSSSGSISGSQTVTATGSGTLKLPGGAMFTNVLQVKFMSYVTESTTSPTPAVTFTSIVTEYAYYHSSQKFPLISVNYGVFMNGTSTNTFAAIQMNKAVVVGLKENSLSESDLKMYPNPAKNIINLLFTDNKLLNTPVLVSTITGRVISTVMLTGNHQQINLDNVPQGIYIISFSNGEVKRIIKQ